MTVGALSTHRVGHCQMARITNILAFPACAVHLVEKLPILLDSLRRDTIGNQT